ncbi:MAG: acyl-CoA dehydrogenase [Nitriliruptorales bacterium]|nr:acyl-CoA dehydrogenase [Nitriliruptorales bacterium]
MRPLASVRDVDFDLDADQRALRDAARELLAGASSMERVRAVTDGLDEDLWKQMVDQGWLAMEVAESDGGLGLGFVETAVLAEQVGAHVSPAPFVSSTLAAWGLRQLDGHADMGARLLDGATIGTVAHAGELVVDGPIADIALIVDADGVRLAHGGLPAVTGLDLTRSIAAFPGGEGPHLGDAGLAAALLDRGATLYALDLLGAAQAMLDVGTEYAKVREQFGQPIGSFQAIKHRLADALVDVEGMRSAAWYAAWAVGAGAEDASIAASVAKSWCSDAGPRVMDAVLQVLGGIGFTWEHDLHYYLKRAHLSARTFGTGRFHRDRLATMLRERIEAGAELW